MSFRIIEVPHNQSYEYKICRTIRRIVFVKEQNVTEEIEFDEFEDEAVHYLVYCGQTPVATGRYRIAGKFVKLERFAVLQHFRGTGAGAFLTNALLDIVKRINLPVYLHAQEHAVDFYKKFGFEIQGDAFDEAGIVHYKMVLPT